MAGAEKKTKALGDPRPPQRMADGNGGWETKTKAKSRRHGPYAYPGMPLSILTCRARIVSSMSCGACKCSGLRREESVGGGPEGESRKRVSRVWRGDRREKVGEVER